jgi:heptaprenyl diphosphate synthase
MSTKRLATDAFLTGIALTIFIIEAQMPLTLAVPGIKLGLANIVSLVAIYLFSAKDAGAILILRIILGSVFSGNLLALVYSITGGAFSFVAIYLSHRFLGKTQIWAAGIFSAIAHNMGQLLAAAFVLRSVAVSSYAPVLIIAAMLTGTFTGLSAQYTVLRLKKLRLK